MPSNYCEDCGCKTVSGVCSNCQEELFIMREQSEFIERPLSAEFLQKADEQRELLKQRKEQNAT